MANECPEIWNTEYRVGHRGLTFSYFITPIQIRPAAAPEIVLLKERRKLTTTRETEAAWNTDVKLPR